MILFLQVDLERAGSAQSAESVMDAVEAELEGFSFGVQDDRHREESDYTISVTAIGTSLKGMQESASRRKANRALT